MFNINDYKKEIIEAYTEVYGNEYKSIIEDRINKQNVLLFINDKNLERFIFSLKANKLNDLNIDFYETFIKDIDLEKYRPKNDNIYSIEDDFPLLFFNEEEPNLEFYEDNPYYKSIISYIGSDKYKECQKIFKDYKQKVNKYKEELIPKEEQEFNEQLKEKYNKTLNELVIDLLPKQIKEALKTEELVTLDSTEILDCFSKKNLKALKEGKISRKLYNEQYLKKYLNILDYKKVDKSNLGKYIPEPKIIDEIQKACYKLRIKYQKEALMNSSQVKNNPLLQTLIEKNEEKICAPVFGGKICQLNMKNDNKIEKLIVFTLNPILEQNQDFTLIHELGHSLTTTDEGIIGIENSNIIDNIERNDINEDKRKYEVFNELLTDIFAYRANKIMQEKNQYIFEDNSTSYSYDNELEAIQFSNYVLPLFEIIEPEIKKSMIMGDQSYIINKIGDENFEKLNELINIRHNLSYQKGLSDKEFDKQVALTDIKKDELYEEIKKHIKEKSKEK